MSPNPANSSPRELPTCPFCEAPTGCSHLVATIDREGQLPVLGALAEVESAVVPIVDQALDRLLKHRAKHRELGVVIPVLLGALARARHTHEKNGEPRASVLKFPAEWQTYLQRRLEASSECDRGVTLVPSLETPRQPKLHPGGWLAFEPEPEPTYFIFWHKQARRYAAAVKKAILQDAAMLQDPAALRLVQVQIGLTDGLPMDEDRSFWPPIPCGRRLPKSAKFLTGQTGHNRYDEWTDGFYLCRNKHRTHWILWMCYSDPYACCQRKHIVAWCRNKDISQTYAAQLLLRAWHHEEKALYDANQRSEIHGGLLSESDVAAIYEEVWPDWVRGGS